MQELYEVHISGKAYQTGDKNFITDISMDKKVSFEFQKSSCPSRVTANEQVS